MKASASSTLFSKDIEEKKDSMPSATTEVAASVVNALPKQKEQEKDSMPSTKNSASCKKPLSKEYEEKKDNMPSPMRKDPTQTLSDDDHYGKDESTSVEKRKRNKDDVLDQGGSSFKRLCVSLKPAANIAKGFLYGAGIVLVVCHGEQILMNGSEWMLKDPAILVRLGLCVKQVFSNSSTELCDEEEEMIQNASSRRN